MRDEVLVNAHAHLGGYCSQCQQRANRAYPAHAQQGDTSSHQHDAANDEQRHDKNASEDIGQQEIDSVRQRDTE